MGIYSKIGWTNILDAEVRYGSRMVPRSKYRTPFLMDSSQILFQPIVVISADIGYSVVLCKSTLIFYLMR